MRHVVAKIFFMRVKIYKNRIDMRVSEGLD